MSDSYYEQPEQYPYEILVQSKHSTFVSLVQENEEAWRVVMQHIDNEGLPDKEYASGRLDSQYDAVALYGAWVFMFLRERPILK
jgi:hypothetical protein